MLWQSCVRSLMPMRMCADTHINLLSVKLQSLPVCFSLLTQVFIVFSSLVLPGVKEDFGKINQTNTKQTYFAKKQKKTGRPVVLFSRVKCRCPAVPPTVWWVCPAEIPGFTVLWSERHRRHKPLGSHTKLLPELGGDTWRGANLHQHRSQLQSVSQGYMA